MTSISYASDAVTFDPRVILVSRTDTRGVIQMVNQSFEQISGYDHSELIGAPHKLVRHPEMPKTVFWLLWRALQTGKSMGAFVKNQTKAGKYYWVFATVFPVEGGFLSARLKPTPEAVAFIEPLYTELLALERAGDLTLEESAAHFTGQLRDHGYETYTAFMGAMLADQWMARAAHTKVMHDPTPAQLQTLLEIWHDIETARRTLGAAHEEIIHTPANLRVQAAHLNDAGVALSVIASNFTVLGEDICQMLDLFSTKSAAATEALLMARFEVSSGSVLRAVLRQSQRETSALHSADGAEEIALLSRETARLERKSEEAFVLVQKALRAFSDAADETAGVVNGLSVAKVMCEIEHAHLSTGYKTSIAATIAELDTFQNRASSQLASLRKALFSAQKRVDRLCRRRSEYLPNRHARPAA